MDCNRCIFIAGALFAGESDCAERAEYDLVPGFRFESSAEFKHRRQPSGQIDAATRGDRDRILSSRGQIGEEACGVVGNGFSEQRTIGAVEPNFSADDGPVQNDSA
ncbi:MAG: hypothetical protein EA417_05630 [Gammaproteobacteria bacterium]|nr:MAG: hypothetical protein EA417_05630 [Gammaproteobacteria bacterium]